jgi:hypothetical protein
VSLLGKAYVGMIALTEEVKRRLLSAKKLELPEGVVLRLDAAVPLRGGGAFFTRRASAEARHSPESSPPLSSSCTSGDEPIVLSLATTLARGARGRVSTRQGKD